MGETIRFSIVGCGGMGHRHLHGLKELEATNLCDFELVGVCDPVEANAQSLASLAEKSFDAKPTVVGSLEELQKIDGLRAVDITTDPRHHHTLAAEAMKYGWDVMVEKPMGLTARTCNVMIKAAEKTGRILAVAENYRRDPINRLTKSLLESGVIGEPRLFLQNYIGGRDSMMISVWRHQKNASGILLDVGVHFSDLMEYLLGEISSVYAQTRLHEPTRINPAAGKGGDLNSPIAQVYGKWQKEMPASFKATAEDAAYGTILFKSGVVGSYLDDHGGHGKPLGQRIIFGSKGSLTLPGDRNGNPITLHLDEGDPINDARILDTVPDYQLDEVTATLFGGDRLWSYDFPFKEVDRKIIAIEYYDLFNSIEKGKSPEVNASTGARSVAVSYALLESGELGKPVSIDEVMSDETNDYQKEINESLGL